MNSLNHLVEAKRSSRGCRRFLSYQQSLLSNVNSDIEAHVAYKFTFLNTSLLQVVHPEELIAVSIWFGQSVVSVKPVHMNASVGLDN